MNDGYRDIKIAYLRSSGIYDDSRATKEIMVLLDEGYIVDVYCWDRTGYAKERAPSVFSLYKDRIHFFFFSEFPGKGSFGKINARLRWARWLYKGLKKRSYSLVHACDYDTGEVALKYCNKKSVKLVYDIFDYYIDAHPVPHILQGLFERREIKVINKSELTIICTEERMEQISKSRPRKVIILHNSPDIEELPDEKTVYDYIYCGGLNGRRLLKEILLLYPQNDDLRFVFGGSGMLSSMLVKLDNDYDNFDYLGSVSYDAVLRNEAKSSVISAIYDPSYRNHRLCAPNKFYEALALGKPVIVCRGTGIDKVVDKYGIGIVIDYDANQFYCALRKLLKDKDKMQQMGVRARDLYCKKYKWSFMRDELLREYRSMLDDLVNA